MFEKIIYLYCLLFDTLMTLGGVLFIWYLIYKFIDIVDYNIKRYKHTKRWRNGYEAMRKRRY